MVNNRSCILPLCSILSKSFRRVGAAHTDRPAGDGTIVARRAQMVNGQSGQPGTEVPGSSK